MWRQIAGFEIRYHLAQPLFLLTSAAFFLFALMLASTDAGVVLSHAPSAIHRDAPIVILKLLAGLTSLGVFVATAFVASSVLRDFKLGTHPMFFTTPVRQRDYLLGRFAGSMVVSLAVFLITVLGSIAGRFVPWQEAHRIGPFAPGSYLYALMVVVLPNLLMMGAVFFAIATLTRSIVATYIGVVFFVCIQDVVETMARDLESPWASSLMEPLGLIALETSSRYWTVAELNNALPGLDGIVLANRLLWLAVGGLALAAGCAFFSYSRATASKRRKTR